MPGNHCPYHADESASCSVVQELSTSVIPMLRTNLPFDGTQLQSIHGAIAHETEIIAELDEQIQSLSLRRQAVTDNRTKLQALVAPVRRLPAEILSAIMLEVEKRPEIDFWDAELSRSRSSFPPSIDTGALILAHVCLRWRETAISTARLWQDIRMYRKTNEPYCGFALQNSGQLPLDVVIKPQLLLDTALTPTLRKVLENAHRWRWAHLDLVYPTHYLPIIKGKLSSLYQLTLLGHNTLISDTFLDAPALRVVTLLSRLDIHDLQIPWNQLTCFEAVNFSMEAAYFVLENCPQLEELNLGNLLADFGISPNRDDVTHHLKTLYLAISDDSSPSDIQPPLTFANTLTLPSLEVLEMAYEGFILCYEEDVMPLISRSACKLTHLSLGSDCTDLSVVKNLVTLLSELPTLQYLELKGRFPPSHIGKLLQKLELDPSKAAIAPLLTGLNICDDIADDEGAIMTERPAEAIAKMIRSRWPKPAYAGVVSLDFMWLSVNYACASTVKVFKELKGDGFDFNFEKPQSKFTKI